MNKLQAPDGMFYTQAADVPAVHRVFATAVYLSKVDSVGNWKLVSAAEKEEFIEAARQEAENDAPPENK